MGKRKQTFRQGNLLYNTVDNYFCIYIQKNTKFNYHHIFQLEEGNIVGMYVVKGTELTIPNTIPEYLNHLIN